MDSVNGPKAPILERALLGLFFLPLSLPSVLDSSRLTDNRNLDFSLVFQFVFYTHGNIACELEGLHTQSLITDCGMSIHLGVQWLLSVGFPRDLR